MCAVARSYMRRGMYRLTQILYNVLMLLLTTSGTSAISNRVQVYRVTRTDYVVRVPFSTKCSIHKYRGWCCRGTLSGCSALTICLRLYRATRKDYVFRVT